MAKFNKSKVIALNLKAMRACNELIMRLDGMHGLRTDRERIRLANLNRALGLITQLRTVNASLKASTTEFKPIGASVVNELNDAGNKLDDLIKRNAKGSLRLDAITVGLGHIAETGRVLGIVSNNAS